MQDILGESLRRLKISRVHKTRMIAILMALSLIVSIDVFWSMRQTGLTLAGDADCGITEHTHSEECQSEDTPCDTVEHVHEITCYSDKTADTETNLDWQEMFKDYPFTGDLRSDLVGIAKTQVGYTESSLNFEMDVNGNRNGYTRYGSWYGIPYSDWSAPFVSFCLNYAGADLDETPINTGASSMAELWKSLGKFAETEDHTPTAGDLVFFQNNTVAIVTEVYNTTVNIIQGDSGNAVVSETVSLTDPSISGWGLTVGTVTKEEPTDIESDNTVTAPTMDELLDISNGPAVFIFSKDTAPPQQTPIAFRATRTVKSFVEYLNANGGNYFFTLLDTNNQEVPKDANGNYVVLSNMNYKLSITFSSPEGIAPGTYQYKIPDGLYTDGGDGSFVLQDDTHVGEWTVSTDGLITLDFNDKINTHTEITISMTMGVHFPTRDEPIDFDGKISVTVQEPPVDKEYTKLNKWGSQGNASTEGKTDEKKLYWTLYVEGHKDSNIPGSILSDRLLSGEWLGDHKYTESDMDRGITVGVSEPDPITGEAIDWHKWVISRDDPNLKWTESGWEYTVPEKATCIWCGEVELGNKNWTYTFEYSSTPDKVGVAGSMGYMNQAIIDGQLVEGWSSFTHGEILGEIAKNGTFVSDASGGYFLWEVQTTIPGRADGQKAEYFWFMMDYIDIRNSGGGLVEYITNDINKSTVTANGVAVPRVQDATASDDFAWNNSWSMDHNGVYYGREIDLLCRCHCTEETCPFWNGGKCTTEYWFEADDGNWYTNGFCQCWTETENTTFTFLYKTDNVDIIDKYGGIDYKVRNEAYLYNKPNGVPDGVQVDDDRDNVIIPGVFKKEITKDFDGYTAHYNITVNEAKIVLTDGSPLTIHDVMTNSLVYISGSMVITAEDSIGNRTVLTYGDDYTVTYDGSGDVKDSNGDSVHVLDVVILHPQPVMYILDYDTTLIIPSGVTSAIKYTNSAYVTLWGKQITSDSIEKVHADINISSKSFKVEMFKTCASTGKPLAGATFGMYNALDGLITTKITDEKGQIDIQSDIINGIVLREHMLYYMQEINAPTGYQLDDTKYWFVFCDNKTDSCPTCAELLATTEAKRIPFEQIGKVNASNWPESFILPETGGIGTYPIVLVSVTFIITPLVYIFILRRKRERRGIGKLPF